MHQHLLKSPGLLDPNTPFPGLQTCFSSHEVPDFWPDLNYPSNGDETWFAAHLVYWVPQGGGIKESVLGNGCLVVSVAAQTPSALGWTAGNGGSSQCPATGSAVGPSNTNAALNFSDLTTMAKTATPSLPTCTSWGDPAIIVMNNILYLATNCLYRKSTTITGQEIVVNYGYYVFQALLPTGTSTPLATDLTFTLATGSVYPGPYNFGNLPGWPSYPFTPPLDQPVNSITELKFALAADQQTIIAVVTPEYIPDTTEGDSGMSMQYGCMATTFSLTSGSGFGDFLAFVTDMGEPSNLSTEMEGPNGCTYEPTSNNGMTIVRHTLGPMSINSDLAQNQFFYIVPTGVFP